MLRWVIFEAVFLSTCGYALWRGGSPERIASLALLIAATVTPLLRQRVPTEFQHIEVNLMLIDLAVFGAMVALAFVSERFWPLWMAAMAGITVLVHLSIGMKFQPVPWAYWRSEALWSYPMQLLLAVATWRHRWRLTYFGADPSWKPSSSR